LRRRASAPTRPRPARISGCCADGDHVETPRATAAVGSGGAGGGIGAGTGRECGNDAEGEAGIVVGAGDGRQIDCARLEPRVTGVAVKRHEIDEGGAVKTVLNLFVTRTRVAVAQIVVDDHIREAEGADVELDAAGIVACTLRGVGRGLPARIVAGGGIRRTTACVTGGERAGDAANQRRRTSADERAGGAGGGICVGNGGVEIPLGHCIGVGMGAGNGQQDSDERLAHWNGP
jgi:hypothetical protein